MARYLGIDYGTVRVGLSISDSLGIIARPYNTLSNNGIAQLAKAICEVIKEKNISSIVFGRPLRLSGEEGDIFNEISKLAELIATESPELEINFQDERFSSIEACSVIHEMGHKPSKNKAKVDAIAASVILQAYLESINQGELGEE